MEKKVFIVDVTNDANTGKPLATLLHVQEGLNSKVFQNSHAVLQYGFTTAGVIVITTGKNADASWPELRNKAKEKGIPTVVITVDPTNYQIADVTVDFVRARTDRIVEIIKDVFDNGLGSRFVGRVVW